MDCHVSKCLQPPLDQVNAWANRFDWLAISRTHHNGVLWIHIAGKKAFPRRILSVELFSVSFEQFRPRETYLQVLQPVFTFCDLRRRCADLSMVCRSWISRVQEPIMNCSEVQIDGDNRGRLSVVSSDREWSLAEVQTVPSLMRPSRVRI